MEDNTIMKSYHDRLYEDYVNQAHTAIDSGYKKAIIHYKLLKDRFQKKMQEAGLQAAEDFLDNLLNYIETETENELEETFNKSFDAVKDLFSNYIISQMTYNNGSYEKLAQHYKNLLKKVSAGKVDSKRLYKDLIKDINFFLESGGWSKQFTSSKLISQGINQSGNSAINDQLYGYLRTLILGQLEGKFGVNNNPNTKNFKQALKGEYKEELFSKAFENYLKKEKVKITAHQTGSVLLKNKRKSKYDTAITASNINAQDELANILNQLEEFEGTGESYINIDENEMLKDFIGAIQSKSWVVPWAEEIPKGANTSRLGFGGNEKFMPKGEGKYFWHAGVASVMNNLAEAIGPFNVIYSTGHGIYWTSNLLEQFQSHGYVFGYYWNKTEQKLKDTEIWPAVHDDDTSISYTKKKSKSKK